MWALTANTVSQDGFLSSSACCARSAGFPANEWKVECVNPEYLSLGCTESMDQTLPRSSRWLHTHALGEGAEF